MSNADDKPFPPEYYECARKMRAAAERWMREHPCAQVTFNELPGKVGFIGALDDFGIGLLACNEPARDLLRTMDKASGGEGTIMQARAILEVVYGRAGNAPSA